MSGRGQSNIWEGAKAACTEQAADSRPYARVGVSGAAQQSTAQPAWRAGSLNKGAPL